MAVITITGSKVAPQPDFDFDALPLPEHMKDVSWPIGNNGIYDSRDVVVDDFTERLPMELTAFKNALAEIAQYFEINNRDDGFFTLYVSFDGGTDELRTDQLTRAFNLLYGDPVTVSISK